MHSHLKYLWLAAVIALLGVWNITPTATAGIEPSSEEVVNDQEWEAETLLKEAQDLIWSDRAEEALPILDIIQKQYPKTEAAQFARLRRAEAYSWLKQYDNAISTARSIVKDYPKTVLATWAQGVLGQDLVQTGRMGEGLMELYKVFDVSPGWKDESPLQLPLWVIAQTYYDYLQSRGDDPNIKTALRIDQYRGKGKKYLPLILEVARYMTKRPSLEGGVTSPFWYYRGNEPVEAKYARMELALSLMQSAIEDSQFPRFSSNWLLSFIPRSTQPPDPQSLAILDRGIAEVKMLLLKDASDEDKTLAAIWLERASSQVKPFPSSDACGS